MIYVLLALALLAALTVTLGRQADTGGDDLSADQAELLALEVVSYASAVKNTVDQMVITGSVPASLIFARPQDGASFDNPPHVNKVYHPGGGGLSFEPADRNLFSGTDTTPVGGWYLGRFNNIAWTPTSAHDIVLTAHDIGRMTCERINKKITGNTTIPALSGTGDPPTYYIAQVQGGITNATLTATECAACNGFLALCVSNSAGTQWTYYNIISGE
jgi:hypothetical protein